MRALVFVAAVFAFVSCQILDSLTGRIVEPLDLSISNGTTLTITLVVNGQTVGRLLQERTKTRSTLPCSRRRPGTSMLERPADAY